MDDGPRLSSAGSQGDRREQGDHRTQHAIRRHLTRDVVCRDRTTRDAGARGYAASTGTDCPYRRMGWSRTLWPLGRLAGRDGSVRCSCLCRRPAAGSVCDRSSLPVPMRIRIRGDSMRRLMADAPTAGSAETWCDADACLERLSGVGTGFASVERRRLSHLLRPTTAGPHAAMVALVALQRADGSWDLSADVAAAVWA